MALIRDRPAGDPWEETACVRSLEFQLSIRASPALMDGSADSFDQFGPAPCPCRPRTGCASPSRAVPPP